MYKFVQLAEETRNHGDITMFQVKSLGVPNRQTIIQRNLEITVYRHSGQHAFGKRTTRRRRGGGCRGMSARRSFRFTKGQGEKRKVGKMTVNPEGRLILSKGRRRREYYEAVRRPFLRLPMRRLYCHCFADKSGIRRVAGKQARVSRKDFIRNGLYQPRERRGPSPSTLRARPPSTGTKRTSRSG